jgi:hypothetical protein
MLVRSLLLALAFLGLTSTVDASDTSYKVTMTITRNGEAVASPTAVVREGVPASARLESNEPIEIRLLVSGGDPAHLEATVMFGEGQAPTVVAVVGERAAISSQGLSLEFVAEPLEL